MPEPPATIEDALRRSPAESDTVAGRALRNVEEIQPNGQSGDDSLAASKNQSLQNIRNNIERHKHSLRMMLDSLTTPPAQQLLDEVRIIGEELDANIMNCPKVGARQLFDSVCVELAETGARKHRLRVSQKFLDSVGVRWKPFFARTKVFIAAQEEQLRKNPAGSKKQEQQVQVKAAYADLWDMIKTLLKFVDEITRLAVRFSKT